MEALLIVNSLLVATTLYFIRDVHSDFKEMEKSVQSLKEKLAEFSGKFQAQIQSVKERLGLSDPNKESK